MSESSSEAVVRLADSVRLTFHALTSFAAAVSVDGLDPSGRAVLEHLHRNGPRTVPDIARARGVSRQHVQTIVNALRERGLVDAVRNPAHRRSVLIEPTARGDEAIRRTVERERDVLGLASGVPDLDIAALESAAATLDAFRDRLRSAARAADAEGGSP